MRKIIIVSVTVLALAATWYVASPWYALSSLRTALVEGDKQSLTQAIDYPALREDLKAQLNARLLEEASKPEADGLGAGLAMTFGGALVDRMIDGFVTPEGVRRMLAARMASDRKVEPFSDMDVDVERSGLSMFEARLKRDGDAGEPLVVGFRRDGMGWKLISVTLPDSKGSR